MAHRLTPNDRLDRAMLEADLQRRVLYRLRKYHWKFAHAGRGTVGAEGQWLTPMSSGWPDLLCLREGRAPLAIELKRELGVVSDDQLDWLQLMNLCFIDAIVVRPSDLRLGRVDAILR